MMILIGRGLDFSETETKVRRDKKSLSLVQLSRCDSGRGGPERKLEGQGSVARIRLDAGRRPIQVSSLEAGERPKGTPKERKTPKRKQRYLGQV